MLNKTRKTPLKREPVTALEDLRDDCIALFLNSKLNYQQVHAAGGPTPQTISKWLHKETMFPRLDTVRALLKALNADLVVESRLTAETWTEMPLRAKLKAKRQRGKR